MNLDALYLVKLIFGKYFSIDANHVADLLQLDVSRFPVCKRVNESYLLGSSKSEILG